MQEFQKNIIRTAGAGDTFNSGYLSASPGALPIKQRLVLANATTPTKEELLAQIAPASDM